MSYAQAKKKYAKIGIHKDKVVDRDQLSVEQFKPWVEWVKKMILLLWHALTWDTPRCVAQATGQ